MLEEIQELYDYNRWANERVLGAVASLSEEDRHREIGGSFATLHLTLVHLMGSEWIWLRRWKGTSPTAPIDAGAFPDLASLTDRWREVADELSRFVGTLTEARLSSTLDYRTVQGVPYTAPLWQLMRHMANHSTYHRGQIATLMRQLGGVPTSTDLVVYHREKAARAEADHHAPADPRVSLA